MPRGLEKAREAIQKSKGGSYFKLEPGKSGVVRFVEDDPVWAYVHDLPSDGKGFQSAVCLDQDMDTGNRSGEACPGCDRERESAQNVGWGERKYRRKMAGVANVIWRGAPVFAKDDKGTVDYTTTVGTDDALARWTISSLVIEELAGKAATYKGLTTRDFVVTRNGSGKDTRYQIEPVVDDEGNAKATPMTANDKTLAEDAPDLTNYFTKDSYESWGNKGSNNGNSESAAPAPNVEVSPFRR